MEQKHLGKIFTFILVMFIIADGGYIEDFLRTGMDYNDAGVYAFLYAAAEVAISALVSMIIPLICRLIKGQELSYKRGKRLCLANAIITFLVPALFNFPIVGWLGAIFFYFINKWVFVCDKDAADDGEESREESETA